MFEFYRDFNQQLRVKVSFDIPVIAAGLGVILAITVVGVFITTAF